MHPILRTLVDDPTRAAWLGFARLPTLADRFERSQSPPSESLQVILAWLDNRRARLSELGSEPARTAQDEYEAWDDDPTPTRVEVRDRVWERWIAKLIRLKRAEGLLCVEIASQDGEPPNDAQDRALEHLIAREAAIVAAIADALEHSCETYGVSSELAEAARIASIRIHGDGWDGIATMSFGMICEWEVEHGMNVVYHPQTGADWATADGVDDLVAAACPEPPPPPPPSPEDELVTALYSHDEEKVDALRSRGVRAEPAEGSALFGPIHERDVELVRRLLELGADPNRRDSYEGTPLEAARRALAEGTLRLPKRAPWWAKLLTALARSLHAGHIRKQRRNAEAVIRLLENAGAK